MALGVQWEISKRDGKEKNTIFDLMKASCLQQAAG
jgi:hypothetical protein